MEEKLDHVEKRVSSLEIKAAGDDARREFIKARLVDIDSQISSIKSSNTWIMRVILGAIAVAVVEFFLTGGLMQFKLPIPAPPSSP